MTKVHDLDNPNSTRFKLRAKRSQLLIGLIEHIITVDNLKKIRICDLGGTYRYWKIFPFENYPDVTFEIDLVNIFDRRFKEKASFPNVVFTSKIGDGCDMSECEDNAYQICHSNSVIEHVGNWERITAFVNETKRIAEYYFVQTPNYWFPIEPHYMFPIVHFLPRPWHTRVLMFFKKKSFDRATANFEENRMLNKREFKYLFKEAKMHTEWFILPKSYVAISPYSKG